MALRTECIFERGECHDDGCKFKRISSQVDTTSGLLNSFVFIAHTNRLCHLGKILVRVRCMDLFRISYFGRKDALGFESARVVLDNNRICRITSDTYRPFDSMERSESYVDHFSSRGGYGLWAGLWVCQAG